MSKALFGRDNKNPCSLVVVGGLYQAWQSFLREFKYISSGHQLEYCGKWRLCWKRKGSEVQLCGEYLEGG